MTKSREEIQNNLVVYRGFTHAELQARADKNRANFERACQRQGQYLPSETELDRWFNVDEFEL